MGDTTVRADVYVPVEDITSLNILNVEIFGRSIGLHIAAPVTFNNEIVEGFNRGASKRW